MGTVFVSDTPTDPSTPRVRVVEEELNRDALLKALTDLAPRMNSRKRRWWAFKQYDGLADAIWWSDEMLLWPRPNAAEDDALRSLLHFRTTLILGQPDESVRSFWTVAQASFPNWIGFAPDRTTPNPKLVEYHRRMSEAFDRAVRRAIRGVHHRGDRSRA